MRSMALARSPTSIDVSPSIFRRSTSVVRDPLRRSDPLTAGIVRLAIFRNQYLQAQALAPRHCFLDPRSSSSTSSMSKEVVEKSRFFVEWLDTLGNESCNLVLQETSHGFGTVAGPGGVEKGAIVVCVPQKAFMSAEVILRSHVRKTRAPYCFRFHVINVTSQHTTAALATTKTTE